MSEEMTACQNCGHPIRRDRKRQSPTGWTHDGPDRSLGWQGIRCPGRLTGATPTETMMSTRSIAEWDWTVTDAWDVLHAPDVWDPDDPDETSVPDGRTACGITGALSIPGVFTRMGAERCPACCEATGMPPGTGSPKNDERCRPIAERRIAGLDESPTTGRTP